MLRRISTFCLSFLLISGAASAQHLEAWGGLVLVAANLDASVTTEYVPSIQSYSPSLPGSTAGQTVNFVAGGTTGFGGGVNLFFSPHVGFQLLVETDRRDLSGANGNYAFLLNYTARQPPDYVERSYSYSRTFTACDATQAWGCVQPTVGTLRQTTLGFNLVGRWRMGGRVNGEVSGGLSYAKLSGDATALRYSSFRMGGHSTLFSEEYQLGYAMGPAHGYGFNAGATLDVALGGGLAFTADGRYFAASDVSVPLVVTEVTNADTIVFLQDVATIQQNLQPPPLTISPARFRLLVGLKFRR